MRAMVLAAGRGSRLRPLTDTTPKPLLQVADGVRLCDWTLAGLKRAGITELILSEENRKDIAEIKPEYVAGLTFHYVKTNEEVLKLALE